MLCHICSLLNNILFTDKIPARLVLYFLSWSGFLVSFMMRNDMNFAIVAMIGNNTQKQNNNHSYTLNMVIFILKLYTEM